MGVPWPRLSNTSFFNSIWNLRARTMELRPISASWLSIMGLSGKIHFTRSHAFIGQQLVQNRLPAAAAGGLGDGAAARQYVPPRIPEPPLNVRAVLEHLDFILSK